MRAIGFALTLAWAGAAAAQTPGAVREMLDDAVDLYRSTRAEQFLMATDPNERADVLVGPAFFDGADDYDFVFMSGDEAFERAFHRTAGLGSGEAWGPLPLPARVRRVHDGERGGLDATSCRTCHFAGGPDGAGTYTQVGLFRGDGDALSSTSLRDAPHVMGLGYLAALAREIEADLHRERRSAIAEAADTGRAVSRPLRSHGLAFGTLVAQPDGTLDLSGLTGVGDDLVIRPFGWKGRHAELVALSDEALQVHLGLQSTSRIETFAHAAPEFLGDGPLWDPDGDGVEFEANAGQSMLLAAYMSMLSVPRIAVPDDPVVALAWARGRGVFDAVGCGACHVPELRLRDANTTLVGQGDAPFEYRFDLAEAGQDPPRRVDFGPGEDGAIVGGTPLFAFTDLRRHDLGPGLAERDEVLPDGTVVPASVWLTRPLWGLADSAPYLHDGRAPTITEAIEWHGGEAEPSRAAWQALSPDDQAALRVFLLSLTRAPTLLVE